MHTTTVDTSPPETPAGESTAPTAVTPTVLDADGTIIETLAAEELESERTVIDWVEARDLYEQHGLTMREVARRFGCSPQTVSKHAGREKWERADSVVAARDAERRRNIQAAIEATKIQWAQRAGVEADEAGASAQVARLACLQALSDGDARLARAAAIAYGIFVDKAQILTGGATGRTDVNVLAEGRLRVVSMRAEVLERAQAALERAS